MLASNSLMNFPDHQQTGALAEIDVERLFLSWKWNVGYDRIDVGYDLCVTPDRAKYHGARFLVQVKGTAAQRKKKGSVVAPVAKARLREYAEDVLPVFIVRATPDGTLYWAHAQSWALLNRGRLSGSGMSGVRFDPRYTLSDRQGFERYLEKLLCRAESSAAIADLSAESRLLNSLDPRFGVRLRSRGTSKVHEIFAKSDDAAGSFSFAPSASEENLANLRDAVEFGLPRPVAVENFTFSGSPLLEHLSAGVGSGTLTIGQAEPRPAYVRMYPGKKHSITAPEFSIEGRLFTGRKGFAITNEAIDSAFNLVVRVVVEPTARSLKVDLGVRTSFIGGRPLEHVDALRPLANWVDQVAAQRAVFVELESRGKRACAFASEGDLDALSPFLHFTRTVSRLHLVAKTLGSSISLPEDFSLSEEDVGDIDLAYALLKGERKEVSVGPMEFEPTGSLPDPAGSTLLCTTTLSLSILDQPLGDIPVAIELSGYKFEQIEGTKRTRLFNSGAGKAWIAYDEHGDQGVCVRSSKAS